MIWLLILYSLTARMFLFEIKFENLRNNLERKHFLLETFLNCSFCNGFWSGGAVFLLFGGINKITFTSIVNLLAFMVTIGSLAYFQNLITKILKKHA